MLTHEVRGAFDGNTCSSPPGSVDPPSTFPATATEFAFRRRRLVLIHHSVWFQGLKEQPLQRLTVVTSGPSPRGPQFRHPRRDHMSSTWCTCSALAKASTRIESQDLFDQHLDPAVDICFAGPGFKVFHHASSRLGGPRDGTHRPTTGGHPLGPPARPRKPIRASRTGRWGRLHQPPPDQRDESSQAGAAGHPDSVKGRCRLRAALRCSAGVQYRRSSFRCQE